MGLCGDKNDAGLIEQFLHGPENNLWAEAALKALCRYLGLIERYRGLLRTLILSPADEDSTRRMTAIHLAPEYFKDYQDDELGCELVRIFCNFEDRHRLSARDALVTLLQLEQQLKDPHGLDAEEWDEDVALMVNSGRDNFHCSQIPVVTPAMTH